MSEPDRVVPVFPKYLGKGSRGGAVAILQQLLIFFFKMKEIKGESLSPRISELLGQLKINGQYEVVTTKLVQYLQELLRVDQDGHFGPGTRFALNDHYGIDINAIPMVAFQSSPSDARIMLIRLMLIICDCGEGVMFTPGDSSIDFERMLEFQQRVLDISAPSGKYDTRMIGKLNERFGIVGLTISICMRPTFYTVDNEDNELREYEPLVA